MQTVYDWVSLGIFAGLVVLFLQRSTSETTEKDASLVYYLAAGSAVLPQTISVITGRTQSRSSSSSRRSR